MIAWLLASWAIAAECHLATVRPPEARPLAITVPLGQGGAAPRLPVGSLVLQRGEDAQVVSVNWWYREPESPRGGYAAPGDTGLAPATLQEVRGTLLVMRPPPGEEPAGPAPGTLLQVAGATCDTVVLEGGGAVPLADLRWARPVDADQLVAIRGIQAVAAQAVGPVGLGDVPFTDWGRVGLPLPDLRDAATIEEAWLREGLETEAQREKAVTASGPSRGGAAAWLHFLGADQRFSDLWADPGALAALIELVGAWMDHCPAALDLPPDRCTVQVGDLAWYNARRPDPLGHTDHDAGRCVDLRLFRTDGSRYEAFWNRPDDRPGRGEAYDRATTKAFLAFALEHAPVSEILFNDPEVVAPLEGVEASPGHDDHVHLCFGSGG